MKNNISKNRKTNSNNFKEDVITLYEQGYTTTQIANILAKPYKVATKDVGRAFINFKSRISMCILRYKRSKTTNVLCRKLHICV